MGRVEGTIQALVIHDTRIDELVSTSDVSQTYTEAGPQPGSAVASDPLSTTYLQVHNAQARDIDVRCIRGGDPKREGAAWTYRATGEADTAYRGWNEPNLLRTMTDIVSGSTREVAGAVTIPSTGQVVAVFADAANPASSTWDPATRTWGAAVTISTRQRELGAVLLVPETEQVVAWFEEAGEAAYAMVSSDAGTTWQDYERNWLSGGLDSAVTSFRVVRDRYGNLLMVASNDSTGDTWWYLSTDGGHTFEAHPESPTATGFGRTFSFVLMQNGQIGMLFRDFTNADIMFTILDDAYDDPASTAAQVTVATAAYSSLYATQVAVVDDDGTVYAYWYETHATVGSIEVARSTDHGQTWTAYDYGVLQSHHHLLRAACATGGEILLLTEDREVNEEHCLVCGGWENVETDNAAANPKTSHKRFGMGYHASDTRQRFSPGYADWTLFGWTSSGTAPSHGSSEVKFNPAAGTSYYQFSKDNGSAPEGYEFEGRVVSGGSTSAQACCFEVVRSDGVTDYRISIRCSTTGFSVYDDVASTQKGSTVTVDLTTNMQFLVVWGNDTSACTVMYKRPSSSLWLVGVAVTGLSAAGAPLAKDRVRVGCTGVTTSDMRVLFAAWWRGPRLYDVTDSTLSGSRELRFARQLTTLPYPVRDQIDDDGKMMYLAVRGRSSRYTETFSVPAEYAFGLHHLVPTVSPKPSVPWRSSQVGTDEAFEARFEQDTRLDAGWHVVVGFVGQKVPRQIDVELLDSAGTVVGSGTYDGATGFDGLSWTHDAPGGAVADVVRPKSGTANGARYSWEDEWRGGYVVIDPSGTPKVRPILGNSPGYWTDATTVPRMTVRLGDIDGTEDKTKPIRLVHPGGVLVIPGTVGMVFDRVRVTVDGGQPMPDDYFTIGAMVIGAATVPGHPMSRGWSRRAVPVVSSREDGSGSLFISKRGPQRREFTWSYQDGNDQLALRLGSGIDYVAVHSTVPETVFGDVEARLAAALARAKGGAVPGLLLLSVPDSASSSTITDPSLWVYGRLVGSVQANHVLGDAGVSEHLRVESLTLVEQAWDLG